jgi:hypothetical protein
MSFYIQIIIAFALVTLPAYYKLKSDKSKPYTKELFGCALMGAILSLYTGYNSYQDAENGKFTLAVKDKLYQDLLHQNLNTADTIIKKQNIALNRLTSQVNATYSLLNNSQQTLFEISRNDNLLQDVQLNCQIKYTLWADWQYNQYLVGGKQYDRLYGDTYENLFSLVKRNTQNKSIVFSPVYYLDPLTGDVIRREDNPLFASFDNVTLTKKIVGTDTPLYKFHISNPEFSSERPFDKYAIGISSKMQLMFFSPLKSNSKGGINSYNFKTPDLTMNYKVGDDKIKCKINSSECDFLTRSIVEDVIIDFEKKQNNGKIKSLLDLRNCAMIINWFGYRPQFEKVGFRYGEHLGNELSMEVKKIKLYNNHYDGNFQYIYYFK